MLKPTNEEFQFILVWLTDHNNRPLEIEDRVNIKLIIGYTLQKNEVLNRTKIQKIR